MANQQTSIAPWLSVSNAVKAVAFYKTAFNAIETYRLETPDGLVIKLSINGAEFWISGDMNDHHNIKALHPLGGNTVRMILTVNDPDTVFANAISAGATEIFPVDESHGWRLGRIADPFGLHWEIGYQLKQ